MNIPVNQKGGHRAAIDYAAAVDAITAKAVALGHRAQDQLGDVVAFAGGYSATYPGQTIYYEPGGSPVEVHGDIRTKYLASGGAAGQLGIPQTDESPTPDGVGRFNHFQHGSIYWTSRTGPMMVLSEVRARWAVMGWERGSLGYPVTDQRRATPGGPTSSVEWCLFENGAIAANIDTARPVPMALQSLDEVAGRFPDPALLTYDQLGELVGARFNRQFRASPDNVHLRPGVELTGVLPWEYDMWVSKPRSVGFALRGFHDNGLAPDTDFRIEIQLRFRLVWSADLFAEPAWKTLVADLIFLRVTAEGVGVPLVDGKVLDGVRAAIFDSFHSPDPGRPYIPDGSVFLADVPTGADRASGNLDILDVIVTTSGHLQVLVNPLASLGTPAEVSPAYLRQLAAQSSLNDFLDAALKM